jgi:hypothetical protein
VAIVIDGLTRQEWREAIALADEVQRRHGLFASALVLSGERYDELLARGPQPRIELPVFPRHRLLHRASAPR